MEALEVSLWGGLWGWNCLLIFMWSCKTIRENNLESSNNIFKGISYATSWISWCLLTFCFFPDGICLLSLPITSQKHGKSELVFHVRSQRRQQETLRSSSASSIYLSGLGLFAYLVFPAKLHSSYARQQPWPTRIVNCGLSSSWDP